MQNSKATTPPLPAGDGQVFLMDQGTPSTGLRLVALFGIIAIPDNVAVDQQFDLVDVKTNANGLRLTLRNPHEWRDTNGDQWHGKGITAMLKAPAWQVGKESVGLTSTLDKDTSAKLRRRNALYASKDRSKSEDTELTELSHELANLGFANADFRDPIYAAFVRAMAQHGQFQAPTVTAEEQAAQDILAAQIIDTILQEEAP